MAEVENYPINNNNNNPSPLEKEKENQSTKTTKSSTPLPNPLQNVEPKKADIEIKKKKKQRSKDEDEHHHHHHHHSHSKDEEVSAESATGSSTTHHHHHHHHRSNLRDAEDKKLEGVSPEKPRHHKHDKDKSKDKDNKSEERTEVVSSSPVAVQNTTSASITTTQSIEPAVATKKKEKKDKDKEKDKEKEKEKERKEERKKRKEEEKKEKKKTKKTIDGPISTNTNTNTNTTTTTPIAIPVNPEKDAPAGANNSPPSPQSSPTSERRSPLTASTSLRPILDTKGKKKTAQEVNEIELSTPSPSTPMPIRSKSGRGLRGGSSGDLSEVEVDGVVAYRPKKLKRRASGRSIHLEHKKNKIGETVYKGHPSWLLMRDIQTGILNCLEKHADVRIEGPGMFITSPVEAFPMAEGLDMTFKFKDYSPVAFRNLRERFGINDADYKSSLIETEWNEISTPGKSGSIFFFSHDGQYVLKTIPKREAKLLREILPLYYEHMMKNQNSLITRFFGLHRVKPHKGNQVRFLVMGNLFKTNHRIHERFDLKGSTVGRKLSPEERLKKNPTFKDVDFIDKGMKLPFGTELKGLLMEQLKQDVEFLSKADIMDYSLLVGVSYSNLSDTDLRASSPIEDPYSEDDEPAEEKEAYPLTNPTNLPPLVPSKDSQRHALPPKVSIFEQEDGGLKARDENGNIKRDGEYYFFGIIDILMQYTIKKRLEHVYKVAASGGKGQVSSVNPNDYARRFLSFIDSVTV